MIDCECDVGSSAVMVYHTADAPRTSCIPIPILRQLEGIRRRLVTVSAVQCGFVDELAAIRTHDIAVSYDDFSQWSLFIQDEHSLAGIGNG